MYIVSFYTGSNGRSPVKEFIEKSGKSLQVKLARQVRNLAEFGLTRDNPALRKLTGTLFWEIRILGKDSTRIICVVIIKNNISLLHIFKKKSDKTPLKEIQIATKRYKELTNDI